MPRMASSDSRFSTFLRHLECAFVAIAIAAGAAGSAGATRTGGAFETKEGDAYAAAFVSQTIPSFIELFTPTTVP